MRVDVAIRDEAGQALMEVASSFVRAGKVCHCLLETASVCRVGVQDLEDRQCNTHALKCLVAVVLQKGGCAAARVGWLWWNKWQAAHPIGDDRKFGQQCQGFRMSGLQ